MPEKARMNERTPDLTQQVLHPAMHQKLLLRAAELVAMGWTRGTAARDATGQKVRSTAPQATARCVVGAVDRALYEQWALDVYALLGLEVDAYDTAPGCSPARAPAAAPTGPPPPRRRLDRATDGAREGHAPRARTRGARAER